MDTPETDERFYGQATLANAALVEGKTVTLLRDVSETDRYGRLLPLTVFVRDVFVNYELIRQGYAFALRISAGCSLRRSLFRKPNAPGARGQAAGLWAGADSAQNCHPLLPDRVHSPHPRLTRIAKTFPHENCVVIGEDPHRFDGDNDGFGCENCAFFGMQPAPQSAAYRTSRPEEGERSSMMGFARWMDSFSMWLGKGGGAPC